MKRISLYALSPHLVKISVKDKCKPAYYDCTTVYSIIGFFQTEFFTAWMIFLVVIFQS